MPRQQHRILLVDDDPEVRELLAEQIFNTRDFEVFEASDAAEGLEKVSKIRPQLIYLDIVMPGLTGKDFLVGVRAAHYEGPIIVGVKRGHEQQAIEAFRFGATDYITKPIRAAEMMSVVNRAMADVRLRDERDNLFEQLKQANTDLQARLNQLTILQKIGKTLTAMQSLEKTFEAVLRGAIEVTGADHATLLLHDEHNDTLILRAGHNMTLVMQDNLGEVVRDDLARLVMTSQETLVVEGEGLQRFRVTRDIHALIYAPMIVQNKTIGVLTVGNHRKRTGFDENLKQVMGALADHAAVAIVSGRIFAALEQRATSALAELQKHDGKIAAKLVPSLSSLGQSIQQLSALTGIPKPVQEHLAQMQQQVKQIQKFVASLAPTPQ
ncbi:MAG: response regulator [Chloroflexi bacterium]|nr:response regulator [Chloroflexota bacterium]